MLDQCLKASMRAQARYMAQMDEPLVCPNSGDNEPKEDYLDYLSSIAEDDESYLTALSDSEDDAASVYFDACSELGDQ